MTDQDSDPGLMLRATSRIARPLGLALTRLLGRLGLIKVPYGGDYAAAQGRRDPSRRDDDDQDDDVSVDGVVYQDAGGN